MLNQTTEAERDANFDFLLANQDDPNVVGQLIAYRMMRETAEWPPESMAHMRQMADSLNYVLGKITPTHAIGILDEDGEEEID